MVQLTPSFRSKGYSTDSPFKLCVPFPFARRYHDTAPTAPDVVPACEPILCSPGLDRSSIPV